MNVLNKKAPGFLFIGDVAFLIFSLWLTLLLRYSTLPSWQVFLDHLVPFSILIVVWCLVFLIAGLYEKHTIVLQRNLPRTILNAEIANSLLAITFFYLIPYFGITPKTNLFIYLVVSFILILVWRMYGYRLFGVRGKQKALLISSGEAMHEIEQEINNNSQAPIRFVYAVDLDTINTENLKREVANQIEANGVSFVVVDFNNKNVDPLLPYFYSKIFSKVSFIDMNEVYEDIFNRVPLSLVKYSWFLENVSLSPKFSYDFLKRIMDVIVAFIAAVVSLIFYPFIIVAIKLDDGGKIFIVQERVGKNGRSIKTYKFRTMDRNEVNLSNGGANRVTRVGKFLRKTRLDELPQLWSVVWGDMSLIGPRPELPSGVDLYEQQIPYYNVRHLIKPGLSGWAQIYHDNHPHHGLAVDATKEKLSYDLYYLKNRSFILDVIISLKTIKKILSRSGA